MCGNFTPMAAQVGIHSKQFCGVGSLRQSPAEHAQRADYVFVMGKRWIESPLLRFHAWNNMVMTVVALVSVSSIEQSHFSQDGITLLAQDSNITAVIPFIPGRLDDLRHAIHAEFERDCGVDIFVGFDWRQITMDDVHT